MDDSTVVKGRRGRALGVRVVTGGVLIGAWTLGGLWLVPGLIRRAYLGQSIGFLSEIMSGRDVQPVELYLDAWQSAFRVATIAVIAIAAVALFAVRYPDMRKRVISRLVGGTPSLTSTDLLWCAMWLGTLGGSAEALYRGIHQAVVLNPAANFPREFFWMAPLSSGLAGLLLGVTMAALARLGDSPWGAGRATTLLASAAVYAPLQSPGIPLHPAAEVILSFGLGAVIGRAAVAKGEALHGAIRASRLYLASVGLVAAGYGWFTLPSRAEARAAEGRPEAGAGLPNILLVILDTVRAANVSLYGYGRPTTPNLDDWAERGVVFDQAIATAPYTLPSHATMFTGRYAFDLSARYRRPLDSRWPTLAEALDRAGYSTAGFTGNTMYASDWSGLERGFDRWDDFMPGPRLFLVSSWLSRMTIEPWFAAVGQGYPSRKDASVVTRRFFDWLSVPRDLPFFAFINFIDAHSPYGNPFPARFGAAPRETWNEFMEEWQSDPTGTYTPMEARDWMNQYDAALTHVDDEIGVLRDSLAARGLLDETVVIIASDHGEMWGEHGVVGHVSSLYDEVLHVPLMISYPPLVPAGRRVAPYVSLRDLPATIVDLAGLEGENFPGQSLAHLWGPDSTAVSDSPALAEGDYHPDAVSSWSPLAKGDMKSLHVDGFHYVRLGDGTEELYDMTDDPSEATNLASDPEYDAEQLRLRAVVDSLLRLRVVSFDTP